LRTRENGMLKGLVALAAICIPTSLHANGCPGQLPEQWLVPNERMQALATFWDNPPQSAAELGAKLDKSLYGTYYTIYGETLKECRKDAPSLISCLSLIESQSGSAAFIGKEEESKSLRSEADRLITEVAPSTSYRRLAFFANKALAAAKLERTDDALKIVGDILPIVSGLPKACMGLRSPIYRILAETLLRGYRPKEAAVVFKAYVRDDIRLFDTNNPPIWSRISTIAESVESEGNYLFAAEAYALLASVYGELGMEQSQLLAGTKQALALNQLGSKEQAGKILQPNKAAIKRYYTDLLQAAESESLLVLAAARVDYAGVLGLFEEENEAIRQLKLAEAVFRNADFEGLRFHSFAVVQPLMASMFAERGDYESCLSVLGPVPPESDDESLYTMPRVDRMYWHARCLQGQGQQKAARDVFIRVLALKARTETAAFPDAALRAAQASEATGDTLLAGKLMLEFLPAAYRQACLDRSNEWSRSSQYCPGSPLLVEVVIKASEGRGSTRGGTASAYRLAQTAGNIVKTRNAGNYALSDTARDEFESFRYIFRHQVVAGWTLADKSN
jgi:hypothetical protein